MLHGLLFASGVADEEAWMDAAHGGDDDVREPGDSAVLQVEKPVVLPGEKSVVKLEATPLRKDMVLESYHSTPIA